MSSQTFLNAVAALSDGALSIEGLIRDAEALSREDSDSARQLYQLWIAANPDHPLQFVALFNNAVLQDQCGRSADAEASLRRALEINPDFSAARINLGGVLERRGAAGDALLEWRTGLDRLGKITGETLDHKITFYKQISRILADNQEMALAESVLTDCLDLAPEARDVSEQYLAARLAQCKWPAITPLPRVSRQSLLSRLHPLSLCAYTDDPLLQLSASARYVDALCPINTRTIAHDRRDVTIPTDRRLRIGYVSSDLRHHAVGFLMAELFELHDHNAFEITAYYCGPPADDEIHARYKASAAQWRDIRGLSDDAAAAMIAADGIDILVDVNGHTREARLGVFARRPAPIIVNWLGYPGTMGSPFHNYIVADAQTIPESHELYYSERVMRLPCYQPNDRKRRVAETPTRASAGLPDDAFVFCSFNAAHKITRFSFERWIALLQRTENSVLWLLDYGAQTNERLRAYAAAHDVAPERLIFAPKIANPLHLARIALADLVVDTVPYGAHTTASDALWMGVPVLTVAGRCFASRVCASLVQAAGLPELVCTSAEAFVERGVALASGDAPLLRSYRQRLQAGRDTCTLFDTPKLVSSLEGLYRDMAAAHRKGATPQPSTVTLDAYFEIGLALDHEAKELGFDGSYHEIYRVALEKRAQLTPMVHDERLFPAPTPRTKRAAA